MNIIKILHLPKTGGTVLKSTLVKNYKKHNSRYLQSTIDNVYFCNHNEIHKNDHCKYIFIVRDPIERFISHYNYFKHGTKYDTSKYYAGPRLHKHLVSTDINNFVLNSDENKMKKFLSLHKNLGELTKNVTEETKNIIMVGTLESLEDDFDTMQTLLNVKVKKKLSTEYTNKRPKNIVIDELSDKSKEKLKKILKDEYLAIEKLVRLGYLSEDYLDKINQ